MRNWMLTQTLIYSILTPNCATPQFILIEPRSILSLVSEYTELNHIEYWIFKLSIIVCVCVRIHFSAFDFNYIFRIIQWYGSINLWTSVLACGFCFILVLVLVSLDTIEQKYCNLWKFLRSMASHRESIFKMATHKNRRRNVIDIRYTRIELTFSAVIRIHM